MKAFTVYQPYAHAIVAGVKHYETRPRRTHIRGRVAVHAGRLDEVQATKHLTNGEFWAVLEAAGGGGNLPRGAVIGTVEIVDCVPVEELVDSLDNRERLLGDYSPGRFAWVLQNPVMFKTPIPAHGKQEYEPRAEVTNVTFEAGETPGLLVPVLEVNIVDNEE